MSHLEAANLYNIKGLVAVITGGGSGLGRTMALTLATNGASKIFIIGRREDALQETISLAPNHAKDNIIPIPGDVTSQDSLAAAYDKIASQTGHVDLLIVNSGVLGPPAKINFGKDGSTPSINELKDYLWGIPMADFSRVFEVNTTGAYYTAIAFLPLLDGANKRRGKPEKNKLSSPLAQIIMTSSIAGFSRRVPFDFAYNLSKSAVNHLVKVLSTSLTDYNIRVNGIAPGLYYSEMAVGNFSGDDQGVSDGSFPPSMIPITRAGGEEDIAGLVLWMAGASGGYLNGNITVTDGGRLSVLQSSY
ncbi:SDR family NAD(P)-dependent oxidoreductase [Aspergillus undulatus]|uniref:SDR family NAD(P)-dependent oxidoreductase n=1 Tax=Aspergillus undulatus TaxID=1810928 RepID=UPI003CCCBE17